MQYICKNAYGAAYGCFIYNIDVVSYQLSAD